MFAAMSTMPDFFKQRINLFAALAPVTRVDKCKSVKLQEFTANTPMVYAVVKDMPFELGAAANAAGVA
jgi:hypothetical protein